MRPAFRNPRFFGWAWIALLFPLNTWALDFGPFQKLGTAGHNADMEFNETGHGHLVYRRPTATSVHYRHFDGSTWGSEQAINDANSPATPRKLDVNQPRLALAPDGGAWISWARDRPTNVAYLRKITAEGQVSGPILHIELPANVEDLHVLARPGESDLHLIALLVDGETRPDGSVDRSSAPPRAITTGTYDLRIDPVAAAATSSQLLAVDGLGAVLQKNMDAVLGAGPEYLLHQTGRFHRAYYGQNGGSGWTMQILHVQNGLEGELGATQMAVINDDELHLASESYDLETGVREIQYSQFHPVSGVLTNPIKLESGFKSLYGVPAIEAASSQRVFVAWDREESRDRPRLRYAFRDESSGTGVIGPFLLPAAESGGTAEHPASALFGQKVHLVFNDPVKNSLYAIVADFDAASPATPVPTETPISTPTPTPTLPASPTPTATPILLEPGQPRTSLQTVDSSHKEMRIDYKVSSSLPAGCVVQLDVRLPSGDTYGTLSLVPQLRRVRILDPASGTWSLELSASAGCPAQSVYLNHSSAPLASSPLPLGALAVITFALVARLRFGRRRQPGPTAGALAK